MDSCFNRAILYGYTASLALSHTRCARTQQSVEMNDLKQFGKMHVDIDRHNDIESSGRSEEGSHSECRVVTTSGCSICLNDFEIGCSVFVSPPCRHVFHRSCILEWCNGNNTACPYCRQPMISEPQVQSAIADLRSA